MWAHADPVLIIFQFPSLCNQYYKLITFICEIFPEKIPQLPEDLFKSLMFSLELGMTSYPLAVPAVLIVMVGFMRGYPVSVEYPHIGCRGGRIDPNIDSIDLNAGVDICLILVE